MDNYINLISEKGINLGFFLKTKAQEIAFNLRLNLVLISNSVPITYRLVNTGKIKFLKKKKNKNIKQIKINNIKELEIRPNIGSSDYKIKIFLITKFINKGYKVNIYIKSTKGTFNSHIVDKFIKILCIDLEKFSYINSGPFTNDNSDVMLTLIQKKID